MQPLLLAALITFGIAVIILVLVAVLPSRRVSPARLRPGQPAPPGAIAQLADFTTKRVDTLLRRRNSTLDDRLDEAGLTTPARDVVVLVACACFVSLTAGVLLGKLVLGIAMALLCPALLAVVLRILTGRRRNAFGKQLPETTTLLASSLRAGYSLGQAITAAAKESESPTSDEFSRIANELRVGRPLNETMEDTAERMDSQDFFWVAQAVAINREVGGNLADVLEGVGHTIRERADLKARVAALSAEGKLSAYVLIALPFGVAALVAVLNPSYFDAFRDNVLGWIMLGFSAVLLVVGSFWLSKTVQIKY
ncbi:MAG: type II secretion system F family protein [Arachnia sp.]